MSRAGAPLVAFIDGIGLRGPGLDGWVDGARVLSGRDAHPQTPTALVAPTALPPAERRRVGKGVRVALEVGFAAIAAAARDAATLPSVFTSSSGDGDNCDAICRALADDRLISPTRFHNSVHNAPSGYWGIASGSMGSSTSLCAYDDSVIAGLDDAMTQLACGTRAILLVAYDAPYPEPLDTARPTPDSFGVGLVLAREAGPCSLARVEMVSMHRGVASTMRSDSLEAMRRAIPAARILPLLAAIAAATDRDVVLDHARGDGRLLRIHVLTSPLTASSESRSQCA